MVAVHPLFSPPQPAGSSVNPDVRRYSAPSQSEALQNVREALNLTPQPHSRGQRQLRSGDKTQHDGSSVEADAPTSLTPSLPAPRRDTITAENSQTQDDRPDAPLPGPAALPLKPTKSFLASRHRKNVHSIDTVPHQTVMKALQSSRSPRAQEAVASLGGLLSSSEDPTNPITSRRVSQALAELRLEEQQRRGSGGISASRFAALASPCFFHNRFDDAVNIDKILEEIRDDEWLSHSRLLQTATGVREVSKLLQRRPIRRAVRSVMIVTKARDNELVHLTRELAGWLLATPRYGSDVGVTVYVDAKLRHSKRFGAEGLTARHPRFPDMLRYWTPDLCWSSPETFDLVLTLGGDGTVLFTSWLFQRVVPPVLSFGLGSLGFLTPFAFDGYRRDLDRILGDQGMRVNLRMRFTCTVYRAAARPGAPPMEAEQFEVLNELVIDRGPSPYVSNLELYGDDDLLTVVQADGCIFSTPTGSTAYSLSAGGSLVHPDIPAILLTPICPHTLSFRPMLLTDSMLLRVAVPPHSRATAYCAFDGKGRVELRQGDWVEIAASQYPFPSVLSQPTEWFNSISRTLQWNTRGAAQKGWGDRSAATAGAPGAAPGQTSEGDKAAGEIPVVDVEDDGFDIDFDDAEDAGKDSGYSGENSSVGGGNSPLRRNTLAGF